jgi:hypothetical protein
MEGEPGWYVRGQADATWRLTPSLLRLFSGTNLSNGDALRIEYTAWSHFRASSHLHDSHSPTPAEEVFAWWAYMQHHHCPTRLLDWTRSPYVGLYFAVEQLFERDAALWIFPAYEVEEAFVKKFGKLEMTEGWFASHSRDQILVPFSISKHSSRAAAQQAVFTICTDILAAHDDVISQALSDRPDLSLYKVIIPARCKVEFLASLRVMNITAASLFPGIDGVGKAAGEVIRLRAWRGRETRRTAVQS